MKNNQKVGAAAIVCLLGLLALSVPVFDMADDVFSGGKSPLSALVENVALVLLGVSIIGTGVWLATCEWAATYVRTVSRIATLHSVGVAALVTLVVLIQLQLQTELKPFIIAADAVVIGIVGGVVLGMRTAQQEQATDDAAAQRDRFQALFENVPNPIVGVEFVGDVPIVRAVNPAFTEVFGFDRRTIIDNSLEQYIVPPDEDLDPVDRPLSPQSTEDQEMWDSDVIELETVDGRREFIRLTAPVDRGPKRDGYAIYIDVTVQRQRRERLRVLSRTLRHDIRNKLNIIIGASSVADSLNGEDRERLELATGAAEDLLEAAEKTRRVEKQIAGDSDPVVRNLAELIRSAAATVRESYPETTIETDLHSPVFGQVTGAFDLAVEAIIRNGIEHNDSPHPHVEVTATPTLDGEYLDVRIADNGSGIDLEQAEIATGERTTDQKTSHLDGMGLWTARWVMQNSGGDLEFASNSPQGTIVTLRVPYSETPPESEAEATPAAE